MTRAQFVVRNLTRNRRRTLLTVASVAVSICLLAVFCATYRNIGAPPTPDSFDLVLMVEPRTSMMQPLLLSYQDRIARLPGVLSVTPINMVDIVVGPHEEPLFALACDPETILRLRADLQLDEAERRAFLTERRAFVAGRKVAARHGWKVGDPLTLRSAGYNVALELMLRGIYSSTLDESQLVFDWEYLNEALGRPNTPGAFWVLPESAADVPRLTQAIDAQFRNAPVETRTQTMKQFMLDFLGLLGNVQLILLGVSAAVVFAVLLIVANTMGMSIRERTSELAVLRTLGFRPAQVLGLLTAESLAISLAGALAGCGLAGLLLALVSGYQLGPMPIYIQVDGPNLALTLAVAAAIGLVGTIVPAWRASRTSIAEALRYVG